MTEESRSKKVANDASTRAKNAAEVAKGKIKVKAAQVMGDRGLEARGKLDITKGRVKQVGHKIKRVIDE